MLGVLSSYNLTKHRYKTDLKERNFSSTFSEDTLENWHSLEKFPILGQSTHDEIDGYLETTSPAPQSEKLYTIHPDTANILDTSQGAAPLHYESIKGNVDRIHLLLKNGADVDIWDATKRVTPLICAAAYGNLSAVKILLEHGAYIDAGLNGSAERQYSALLWAVRRNHPQVVEYLLENKACQNSTVPFSETPVHAAVLCDSPKILKMLVANQGSRIKSDFAMGPEKYSPLHLAVSGRRNNSVELCKILLQTGNADVNVLDAKRRTPLHGAVHNNNNTAEITNLLLAHGAIVNAEDVEGNTPLLYAISDDEDGGDEEEMLNCLRILVDSGDCNVNHQNNQGCTALHFAGLYKNIEAAELLLMNGADFSIKTFGGVTALSLLRKNIPTAVFSLLQKTFDSAATLLNECQADNQVKSPRQEEKDSKVQVDFSLVLPSSSSSSSPPQQLSGNNASTTTCEQDQTDGQKCSNTDVPNESGSEAAEVVASSRKETSKIKCLVDEGYSRLLLHPVVHSFLDLKWRKVKKIYMLKLALKMSLVLLFSIFVMVSYTYSFFWWDDDEEDEEHDNKKLTSVTSSDSNETFIGNNSSTLSTLPELEESDKRNALTFLWAMYVAIAIMATINACMELLGILRAPKQHLRSFEPWLSVVVWILIFFYRPDTWTELQKVRSRSLIALSILLAWIGVWMDMSHFPTVGLSIRVFLKVLKNFSLFILPHSCLLLGFGMSLMLLFRESKEFQGITLTLAKLVRVMAGDITIVSTGRNAQGKYETNRQVLIDNNLTNYMYTAFVLMVAIVMMNLLIGLAVNDIREIYEDASKSVLVRQTVLLNTLETSIDGKWAKAYLPSGLIAKWINLFPVERSLNKTMSFNPHSPCDSKISSDHRKSLFGLASANAISSLSSHRRKRSAFKSSNKRYSSPSSVRDVLQLLNSTTAGNNASSSAEQRVLLEGIGKLVEYVNMINSSKNK